MDGMLVSDFARKLSKLNPDLWVDLEKISYPYSMDYPTCGLYLNGKRSSDSRPMKYLGSVPQYYIPRLGRIGLNLKKFETTFGLEKLAELEKTGFLPEGCEEFSHHILWRGWHTIVKSLCLQKIVDQSKAEKIFNCSFTPLTSANPTHWVHLETAD